MEKTKQRRKNFLSPFWLLGFFLGGAGLFLWLSAKYLPGFAEGYYEKVYVPVAGALATATGSVPCSLAELCFVLAAVLLIFWCSKAFLSVKRKEKSAFEAFSAVLIRILSLAATVFFLFAAFCGTNYFLPSFAEKTELEVRDSSEAELYILCERLIDTVNERGADLPRNENGETVYPDTDYQMAREARRCYRFLYEDYPFLKMGGETFGTPKPVVASFFMSALQISGVTTPYTLEANVCAEGPDFLRGVTMMHEMSHLRGFMNEAEANFIAYLACEVSDNPYFRYSGASLALLYSMNALYRADPAAAQKLAARYGDSIRADFRAQNAFVAAHETKVAEFSDTVNDTYLKLNGQESGVKSYGEMVDLLLAYQRKNSL